MKNKLIIGLGNIGDQYQYTRHNIGFIIIDYMQQILNKNIIFTKKKLGLISEFNLQDQQVILLKPATYMNHSGVSVKYWLKNKNIRLRDSIIIVDDIHRNFGVIKIKCQGGYGGHNGLKSIQYDLRTIYYNRLYIGIGNNFKKGKQVQHVLGNWTNNELNYIKHVIFHKVYKILISFIIHDINYIMNNFNNK
jgi:PTH1 family peptidyl-tRNA hydrolase